MDHITNLERLHDDAVADGREDDAEFYSDEIDAYYTCRDAERDLEF